MATRISQNVNMLMHRLFGPLAGLAACAAAFCADPGFAATECALKLVASIPTEVTPANTVVASVKINDTPATLRIDTGGATSALSIKFAERLGMPIETMEGVYYGLTGRALDHKTHVRDLHLGDAVSHNADFALMPIGGDGTDGRWVGLFGADYLQNYDVEFDFAGGKMNLFSQDHCEGNVVYWAPEFFKSPIRYEQGILHRPLMEIAVDGQRMLALLDTGAPTTFMSLASARGRLDISTDTPDTPKTGHTMGVEGVKLDVYEHVFQTLTFGEITLHNTKMEIIPIDTAAHVEKLGSHLKAASEDEPDVYIGMNFMKKLHLFLAYSEHAIYYTIAPPKQAAGQ
ncbi:hypothetical protein GCM10011611_13010 [Aliidongia dinghuensis]|uniref:Aspartyl protease n=1 Tax=Aliidongia dinghuensis TaxID=1867774 RepID=A0A8J3E2C2_9PROT|nr:aspartyl protease family protein [Aliidongia dinghuensis]GGF08932.1 hypothetical protein GCM10011611_13010 [Aliidongia dinghuensis]